MYGENGALLRAELSALLAQHRVQLRLGGGGSHSVPVTTSRADREEIGKQIRRYRQSVLVWCQQASRAVAPHASSNLAPAPPTPFRLPPTQHGGLASLRLALDHAVDTSSAPLPSLHELVVPQELPHPPLVRGQQVLRPRDRLRGAVKRECDVHLLGSIFDLAFPE